MRFQNLEIAKVVSSKTRENIKHLIVHISLLVLLALAPSVTYAQYDSLAVSITPREIPQEKIEEYRAQEIYTYKEEGEYQPNILARLWQKFEDWLQDKIGAKGMGILGKVVLYTVSIVGVMILLYFILGLLGYNKGVFSRKSYKSTALAAEEIDETSSIESIDRLIKEAEQSKNHRLAIRLLYLKTLKLLDDNNRIEWRTGKTNHEYLRELSASNIYQEFDELSYLYEYLWYGQFELEEGMNYPDVKQRFNNYYTTI